MGLEIREIDKRNLDANAFLAFYNYYERLYGKALISTITRKAVKGEINPPSFLAMLDDNYQVTCRLYDDVISKNDVVVFGIYAGDVLIAYCNAELVFEKSVNNLYIGELAPVTYVNGAALLRIVQDMEIAIRRNGQADFLSFLVPYNDKLFKEILSAIGYGEFEQFDEDIDTITFSKDLYLPTRS